MKQQYLVTIETSGFRPILSLENKNITLMDEEKFHKRFRKAIENKIEQLIHEDFVDGLEIEGIFPEEWDVLKDMVTVKMIIDNVQPPEKES